MQIEQRMVCARNIWVWVNTYRYIFSGMNIHLPAILGFTRYQGFDPSPFGKTVKGSSFASRPNSEDRINHTVHVCPRLPQATSPKLEPREAKADNECGCSLRRKSQTQSFGVVCLSNVLFCFFEIDEWT